MEFYLVDTMPVVEVSRLAREVLGDFVALYGTTVFARAGVTKLALL